MRHIDNQIFGEIRDGSGGFLVVADQWDVDELCCGFRFGWFGGRRFCGGSVRRPARTGACRKWGGLVGSTLLLHFGLRDIRTGFSRGCGSTADLTKFLNRGFEFLAAEATAFRWALGFESVDQRQQVASGFAGVAVDLLGDVLPHGEVAVLAVAAGFVEDALHAVFAGAVLRVRQSIVLQHERQGSAINEIVNVAHVAVSGLGVGRAAGVAVACWRIRWLRIR